MIRNYVDILRMTYLNGKEKTLDEIQVDIDRARKKYFDVSEIQLRLDRRQQALDKIRKETMDAKGELFSPN